MAGFLLGVVVAVLVNLVTALVSRQTAFRLIPFLLLYFAAHGTLVVLNTAYSGACRLAFRWMSIRIPIDADRGSGLKPIKKAAASER